jgi:hypothetical protein
VKDGLVNPIKLETVEVWLEEELWAPEASFPTVAMLPSGKGQLNSIADEVVEFSSSAS